MIKEFREKYFFLSNFYTSPVIYLGVKYLNNEAAFQAQKAITEEDKMQFAKLYPSEAKKAGRRIKLRSDWELVKDEHMYEICLAKFTQNEILKAKLLATGDEILEEGNNWGDREWGVVNGVGKNKLGKILMRVREELQS